jgi:hypothetical protein
MTLDEQRQRNDALRTTFKGGRLLMTPVVRELDPHLRGRIVDRLTRYDRFDEESDHSCGVFIFAGYSFVWWIEESETHGRTLTVDMHADLLR